MTLAWLAAAWLAGLFLGFRFDVAPEALLLLAGASLAFAALTRVLHRNPMPLVLIAFALLGFWRAETLPVPGFPILEGDAQPAGLRGSVNSDPETARRSVRFVLSLSAVDAGSGWEPASGKTLVYAQPPTQMVSERSPPYFLPGDVVELRGASSPPQSDDGFDYRAYLASHGIQGVFFARDTTWVGSADSYSWRVPLFKLRRNLAASLDIALPAPHASLAQALLLGWRSQIPPEVREGFRRSGAAHLLAISGMHVGILLVIATAATGWALGWRRWQHWLVPIGIIWVYGLVSGLPVSVVRAGIMGTLFLAAAALGRPYGALAPLSLAALIITALDPRAIFQVSFQLSFTAMAGIIIALPWQARVSAFVYQAIDRRNNWWRDWAAHLARWTTSGLIVSLGATVGTLPLVAYYFQNVPVWGIPVTILALPSLPFVLGGSLLTALGGLIHPLAGQLLVVASWLPISYLLLVATGLPSPGLSGEWASPGLLWAWYGGVVIALGITRTGRRRRKGWVRLREWLAAASWGPPVSIRPGGKSAAAIGLAILMASSAIVLWVQAISGSDDRLHVYFFDVGQGDSALIVTPEGRQVLIDGGRDSEGGVRALSGALPFWDRSLDLVVMTHLDEDHAGGLPAVLDRYQVGGALVGAFDPSAPLEPAWTQALSRSGTTAIPVSAGHRVDLGSEVRLLILNPGAEASAIPTRNSNNDSLAFLLSHRGVSFLFTADVEEEAERRMLSNGEALESDVLKVGHHGSRTSTSDAFLEAVNPSAAVVSAGADNRYGHPHPEVMDRLEQVVGPEGIYQTARHGTIHFASDGTRLWVETETR